MYFFNVVHYQPLFLMPHCLCQPHILKERHEANKHIRIHMLKYCSMFSFLVKECGTVQKVMYVGWRLLQAVHAYSMAEGKWDRTNHLKLFFNSFNKKPLHSIPQPVSGHLDYIYGSARPQAPLPQTVFHSPVLGTTQAVYHCHCGGRSTVH